MQSTTPTNSKRNKGTEKTSDSLVEVRQQNVVYGQVIDLRNHPVPNVTVQVYDRDMRSEELLAEVTTSKDGRYKISWSHHQLSGRGRKSADLAIKVLTAKNKAVLYESDVDGVRFNASKREEMNVRLRQIVVPEETEYAHILEEVTFLAGEIPIAKLEEGKSNRDITFLSREIKVSPIKIEHLVVSHRLQELTQIDAEFFYALLRKDTLLRNDFINSLQARMRIDIQTELKPLLFDAALTDPQKIQGDVEDAIHDVIVSPALRKDLHEYIKRLQEHKASAEEYYKSEHSTKVLNLISQFVVGNKISEVMKAFEENRHDLGAFVNIVSDESFFESKDREKEMETSVLLAGLFGFDQSLVTSVTESKQLKRPEDIKRLAKLTKKEWKDELLKAAHRSNVKASDRLIDIHASSIVRAMEKTYPTTAFTAQLEREQKMVVKNQKEITNFLTRNEDFDFLKNPVDQYLSERKVNGQERNQISAELKSIQRVFKLVPHYGKVTKLLEHNIHSAQSIASIGKTRFMKEVAPKAGISPEEAKEIYAKAEAKTNAAAMIVGELQETMNAMDIASIETTRLDKKLEAVSKDFPNLKSLFKLSDVCACEHCRSVYSPAAYLVEILQFIDKRSVTDRTTTPPTPGHLAKDVLFARRPDLGDIDLGCENANTPVPYIDLVCELLEEAILPDKGIDFSGNLSDGADPLKGKISNALLAKLILNGIPVTQNALLFETETTGSSAALPHYVRDKKAVCKVVSTGGNNYKVYRLRQTLSPAEELSAAPEYVNKEVYRLLSNELAQADPTKRCDFAFKLPFDLNHAEAIAYFARFDVSRAKLMKAFQTAGGPPEESISAEALGLTDAERKIVTIAKANLADQQAFWNAPAQWGTPPIAGDVVDYMKVVDHFLTKTGLTYAQVERLLALEFIDPDDNLFIKHLDLSCDTEHKEIVNLDVKALDRIHRFLRLQKKTGWKADLLNEIIMQPKLGNGQLDDACLNAAAMLVGIEEETGIKLEEIIGFFGVIPFELTLQDDDPLQLLYYKVFLNKAKNGFIDEKLFPDQVQGANLLSNVKTSLSVSLQIKEGDLVTLFGFLPDGNLTFSNLSYLFAAARIMKKLKFKAEDFLIMSKLLGVNIQSSPAEMLKFIKALKDFSRSPLKVVEVQYMLSHEAANLNDRALKDEKILPVVQKLQKEYQANFAAFRSAFNPDKTADEQKEALQTALSGLAGIEENDVKALIEFIDRNYTSVADAKNFVDDKLSDLFDTTSVKNAIDALEAAPGPDINAEQNDVIESFLSAIASFQLSKGKQTILETIISSTFKAEPELAKVVLELAELKQPAPGKGKVRAILSSDTLIDTDVTHEVPILPPVSNLTFPDHYAAFRLMHKLFPLLNALGLSVEDVGWFLNNNKSLGWFEPDGIPYEPGHAPISYKKYIDFAWMLELKKSLTPVEDPSDAEKPISFFNVAEMLLPGSAAARNEFIRKFSLLTGYDKTDVDAIDAHFHAVFNLADYRDIKTWDTIVRAAEYTRKLGSTVAQILAYIKPILTSVDTHALRTALKARYDEDTWRETLKQIMDKIRPQKRDALIAYILATNPSMKDENDLYDYFLVDVKMEACMPSSRIVQAHTTVQLFVQRCLMGLEPKSAADVTNDKAWEQWKWMKNYRLWEANRKVFLYPENWIEPELRDDKSFLFTELENELLQNEVNAENAEQSLIRYLEKLDAISFLEVSATWYQSDTKTMHVFARSKGGDPAMYFYRRFEQERYWTPWEKVELDITSDQLLAFVRNNRLSLAWPVFTEEADPNPQSTVPDSTPGTVVNNDKPRRKLRIQLAVSELSNKKWQPKKLSRQGITTPADYTTDNLFQDKYNLMYNEISDQVMLFTTNYDQPDEMHQLNGIFNLAGCKGYPELFFEGSQSFPDFYPDFKDTLLKSQRYNELALAPDDLAVRNGVSLFSFYEILLKTPGTFRLSYPHQITKIDLVVLLFEYLLLKVAGNAIRDRGLKFPFGTLLPYFKEDSNHDYVIIPGFYSMKVDREDGATYTKEVRRTASNVMKFIEDIIALFTKYLAKYQADPAHDLNKLLQELVADDEYQKILAEFKIYKTLKYGEAFKNLYHPLVCSLRKTLYKGGIDALMQRQTQLQKTPFDFKNYYSPNPAVVPPSYHYIENGVNKFTHPIEDIDFSSDGSYSIYNWELFFHVPFLMATRLSKNQKFEEAMTWFHYMFNPTGALEGTTPQKYWVTKPFYQYNDSDYISQRIDNLLYKVADSSSPEKAELEFAIEQWRNKPYKPHVVARFRPVAYQKALLMKYIDNLIEWGDYLFRLDTMESIAQATQMYILADKSCGPMPRLIPPPVKPPYETYNQIVNKIDAFGNALIELENILPDISVLPENGQELPTPPITLSMLYFCIPQNEKLLDYWRRIEDRLFKIRNCQNIDGVERSLALFAPPIDPGMLVRAAAAGLDMSSILAGINAPTPYYRFHILSQKATELTNEVRALGASLLQVIEKRDAEALSLLRNELEVKVLNAMKDVKKLQIKEAEEQIEVLNRTKKVTEERYKFFKEVDFMSPLEITSLVLNGVSAAAFTVGSIMEMTAGATANIPDVNLGASGFGGSPHAVMQVTGGKKISSSIKSFAKGIVLGSQVVDRVAGGISTVASFQRRYNDWKLQERVSKKELATLEKQIVAAQIRKEISEKELTNHEIQIDNSKKTDDFMRSKFTNQELYEWMMGQISAVYFRSYQLAHDFAKKAERSYRFELGNDDTFIMPGYWDSLKKGLQSADQLLHDIKRMETSYLDKNKREYELTKHISLSMLDPLALVRLRATGVCDFEIPEALFDMDYAGQYFRRIKSVSLSLPCIAGPYTSVSAKLSLVKNRYRKNANLDNSATTGYTEDPGSDERFVYNIGAIQSIATSTGQNDNGMFELSFRDDRYLPFEGTGAISTWRLELPELAQINYNQMTDAILHLKYTAREGGSSLKTEAMAKLNDALASMKQGLNQTGLHVPINLKHDLPNDWHMLKKNGKINLIVEKLRLPYFAQAIDVEIEDVVFVTRVKNNPATFAVKVDGVVKNLARNDQWKLCTGIVSDIELDTQFELSVANAQLANLEELIMVVKYAIL